MKVGDLIMTVYRKEWAVVVKVHKAVDGMEMGAEFIYPCGKTGTQPRSRIREVFNEGR